MLKIAVASIFMLTMTSPFQSGNKRMVLLFSSAGTTAMLQQQIKVLNSDTAGIQERDIIIEVHLADERNIPLKLLNSDTTGIQERDIIIEVHLADERNIPFFKKFHALNEPFLFVLIGKDGGEKLRSTSLVSTQKLFGLIDQMPMRRQEMKKRLSEPGLKD